MKTAKVITSGNSQAVRIPKEFQLEGARWKSSDAETHGCFAKKRKFWTALIQSLKKFTSDFMAKGRRQPPVQKRGRAFS